MVTVLTSSDRQSCCNAHVCTWSPVTHICIKQQRVNNFRINKQWYQQSEDNSSHSLPELGISIFCIHFNNASTRKPQFSTPLFVTCASSPIISLWSAFKCLAVLVQVSFMVPYSLHRLKTG